ncbi:DUF7065 domain-containing protein [Variovorax sp. PBL-E5]|uniref:DUF7065 domain-containing protein n=1 Tax=Variovorax sp. PBL-E5 TaxID=434014 RepID=UPI001317C1A1|nr:hypothetical protein [Variovorax sp. PBL-E5]VTU30723.1 hypothetical protein E5CHR_03072 [Variovorax sp. PBL-E5]
MIQASDTEFHPRDPADRIWTETTYLAFNVPEAALHGTCYVLARPNLGVAMSSVVVARGMRRRPHEVDFCDPQIHLPCPSSYASFSLANGLAVEARSLTDWHFRYEHKLGACSFDLHLQGLHHPFDPTDPRENPMIEKQAAHSADPRIGDAWSHGHFDLKGRITGTLTLRGHQYQVDCYEGMDRSWGPRNETPNRATSYISVNCGDAMAMWLTMTLDVTPSGHVRYERLNSGFLVEHGVVTPIVAAQVEAATVDMLAISDRIVVTDARGRTHEFFGATIGTRPMGSLNPSIAAFVSLMRYQYGKLVGHGGHGKLFGLSYLAERLAGGDA